ncbi:MAG: hypothetical protein ACOC1F_01615 [Myxococcota bacterium]
MNEARRFNARIVVGGVPDTEDLVRLHQLRYGTVVDVRTEDEKGGGRVQSDCVRLGMRYVGIPIGRDAITTKDVLTLYDVTTAEGSGLMYCFSRYGKRPLSLLLLFEAIARGKPMAYVHRRAANFGFNLEGDLLLNNYLVHFYNNTGIRERVTRSGRRPLEARLS